MICNIPYDYHLIYPEFPLLVSTSIQNIAKILSPRYYPLITEMDDNEMTFTLEIILTSLVISFPKLYLKAAVKASLDQSPEVTA